MKDKTRMTNDYPPNALTWINVYGETIAAWLQNGRMKVWHSDLEGTFYTSRKRLQFAAQSDINETSSVFVGVMISCGKCILQADEIRALLGMARKLKVL